MREFEIIHSVSEGESLPGIAAMYGVPAGLVISANAVDGEIYAGQRLIIPALSGMVYKVKPSDSIEALSKKFGVPAQKILSDNNTDMIFPFMDLLIK